MNSASYSFLALGAVVANAWLGYGAFMHLASRISRTAVEIVKPRSIPFYHGLGIAIMPSWCAIEIIVYLLLAWVADLPIRGLFGERLDWIVIPRGIFLGVAEVSFSMMIATLVFRIVAPFRNRQRGGDAALEYQILGQGGWMRSYMYVFKSLPWPVAVGVGALPLLAEELIFRAAAVSLLLPLGSIPAVTISTLLFAAAQVSRLPSWYQAIAPVSGALVMGACNGLLFAVNGNLLPLLIAHATFVVIVMGRTSSRAK